MVPTLRRLLPFVETWKGLRRRVDLQSGRPHTTRRGHSSFLSIGAFATEQTKVPRISPFSIIALRLRRCALMDGEADILQSAEHAFPTKRGFA